MDDDPDFAQRALLGLLLEAHPAMLDIADIRRRLSDVADLADALEELSRDGVVTRLGDLVGASRAAVRTDQLALWSCHPDYCAFG
jgi:hypothetical protein